MTSIAEKEFLKSLPPFGAFETEQDLLNSNSTYILSYIYKFNKHLLLKEYLQKNNDILLFNSFSTIKSTILFSTFLYSDFVRKRIKDKNTKYELLKMSFKIRGGLDMTVRKLKIKELKFDETDLGPLNGLFNYFDLYTILNNASIKDINTLLTKSNIHDLPDSIFPNIFLKILKNDIKILQYFLQIKLLLRRIFITLPQEVFQIFWSMTIYSKIFSTNSILSVLNGKHDIPLYTKKLLLLYNNGFINKELLYQSDISHLMTKNINLKLNHTFCKYNNFIPLEAINDTKLNAIPHYKIPQLILKSMKHQQWCITISLPNTSQSVLYGLYPSIPLINNNKLEYSYQTIIPGSLPWAPEGLGVYIVSDYFARNDQDNGAVSKGNEFKASFSGSPEKRSRASKGNEFKDRMDKLSMFHPWANKEFKSLKEEMDALESFMNENKDKDKLWWPIRYFTNDKLPLYYPDTLYENNGWLFLDSQGLEINFNSKYKYIYKNTNWLTDTNLTSGCDNIIIDESKIRNPEDSNSVKIEPKIYPDGLWKCKWKPQIGFNSYRPIELLDNKESKSNVLILNTENLNTHYKNIIIPNNVNSRYKINPNENTVITSIENQPISWINMGCGADNVKNMINIDINPFYSHVASTQYCNTGIMFKYCDWIFDTCSNFLKFLKLINEYDYVYLVIIDASNFEEKWYFEDGSWLEKTDNTVCWSCDMYKAKGLINWLYSEPTEFFIASSSLFINNMPRFELICEYKKSAISGLIFKKIKEDIEDSLTSFW